MNNYPLSLKLVMKHSLICAFKTVYISLYLYYIHVYCFTVFITPCSSIYSHALYSINSTQCKCITRLDIVILKNVTNCLYVVLHCTCYDHG